MSEEESVEGIEPSTASEVRDAGPENQVAELQERVLRVQAELTPSDIARSTFFATCFRCSTTCCGRSRPRKSRPTLRRCGRAFG
jgi:hypothetical protein